MLVTATLTIYKQIKNNKGKNDQNMKATVRIWRIANDYARENITRLWNSKRLFRKKNCLTNNAQYIHSAATATNIHQKIPNNWKKKRLWNILAEKKNKKPKTLTY